jgi:hypothetical protein
MYRVFSTKPDRLVGKADGALNPSGQVPFSVLHLTVSFLSNDFSTNPDRPANASALRQSPIGHAETLAYDPIADVPRIGAETSLASSRCTYTNSASTFRTYAPLNS